MAVRAVFLEFMGDMPLIEPASDEIFDEIRKVFDRAIGVCAKMRAQKCQGTVSPTPLTTGKGEEKMRGAIMKPIALNNLKTLLIFLGITLVFALPVGYVASFAEKNANIKGTAAIAILTIIAFAGYFILGRIFLTPQNHLLHNILSTMLPLILSIIFLVFRVSTVLGLTFPFFPIMALLVNTTPLSQDVCIAIFSVLPWIGVTLGLFSKKLSRELSD